MSTQRSANGLLLPRPFLKWVGGKRQLLPELMKRVERAGDFGRYHEPFVGGGALFFELYRNKKFGRPKAWLSDQNLRLVETYNEVSENLDEVIESLESHKKLHNKEHYYKIRALGEGVDKIPKSPPERAARIIYLNKTCFNGLYRENSKGEFNTPIGRYVNPQICDEPNLRAVSEALHKKAKIEKEHFGSVVKRAEPGDLVYFDPPYDPLSDTASFTGYVSGGFAEDSQRLLAKVCEELNENGVKFILSNSKTTLICKLYESKDFNVETVYASRQVSSKADDRGKIPEVVVTNFK